MTDQSLDVTSVIDGLRREAAADVVVALSEPLVAEKVQRLTHQLELELKALKKSLPELRGDIDVKAAESARRQAEVLRLRGELAQAIPDPMRATNDQLALHGRLTTELSAATSAWQSYQSQPDLARRKLARTEARIAELGTVLPELRAFAVSGESKRIRDLVLSRE